MTVLITGANKGIGLAIAKLFAKNSYPSEIIITSRNLERGTETKNSLEEEFPSAKFGLCQLDLLDENSINDLANEIEKKYGKIDILINNSGRSCPPTECQRSECCLLTFETNFGGTVRLTEKLQPLIRKRIVTVGSGTSMYALSDCGIDLQQKVVNSGLTSEELAKLTQNCVENIKNGLNHDYFMQPKSPSCYVVNDKVRTLYPHLEAVPMWPQFLCVYCTSKMFIRIQTKIWAEKWASSGVKVFNACPGWVATNIGGQKAENALKNGAVTTEQGADVFWWLATTDDENVLDEGNGGFFYNGRELEMGWGLVERSGKESRKVKL